jgi:hypothetical protein
MIDPPIAQLSPKFQWEPFAMSPSSSSPFPFLPLSPSLAVFQPSGTSSHFPDGCAQLTFNVRHTPIGSLHRVLWIHTPNLFYRVDSTITGGRFSSSFSRLGQYLLYEKHPIVLVRFHITSNHLWKLTHHSSSSSASSLAPYLFSSPKPGHSSACLKSSSS